MFVVQGSAYEEVTGKQDTSPYRTSCSQESTIVLAFPSLMLMLCDKFKDGKMD